MSQRGPEDYSKMLNINTTEKEAGKFKLTVRQEGYHTSGYTRGTVVDDFYLVGKGPLSLTELVEDIFWPIIKQVSHDYNDPSRVLASEFADAIPAQHSKDEPAATTATESTYKSHNADTEFNIYFFRYEDVAIEKDGCMYGDGMMWTSPSKESLHEAAEYIDNEIRKKHQGLRRQDYRWHKPLYRPPVRNLEFKRMTSKQKTRFTEAHSGSFGLKALSPSEMIHEDGNWVPEIISSTNEPKNIKPAISWRYTGRIDHCGIPSDSPGFTIVAIPPLEEFIIESRSFPLNSSEVKDNVPTIWNPSRTTCHKEPQTDPRGIKYFETGRHKMFVGSESDLIVAVDYILSHFAEALNERSYQQILEVAYGVGDINGANLRAEFTNFRELSHASKKDLMDIEGIGNKTATNIIELIENRNQEPGSKA